MYEVCGMLLRVYAVVNIFGLPRRTWLGLDATSNKCVGE